MAKTSRARRRRAGRPPVADEDRRDSSAHVLMTSSEHEEVRRAAASAGVSASLWMRTVALQHAREVTPQVRKIVRAIVRRQARARRAP
jgi:Mobilization protein NikA